MARYQDLTGQQFGKLVVLDMERRDSQIYWRCQCECGGSTFQRTHSLIHGLAKSCGCLQKEASSRWVTAYNAARRDSTLTPASNQVYNVYRTGARRRRLAFDLSRAEFLALAVQPCHYCGTGYSMTTVVRDSVFEHNGIDRIDNDKGYTATNVVPCCKTCNRAKFTMSAEEFYDWLDRLARWRERQ